MLRAVLDTNVIVSGTIAKNGVPFRILEAWRRQEWSLVLSLAVLDEVQRVLRLPKIARKYRLTGEEIDDTVRLLRLHATVVPGRLAIPPASRDPGDDPILACAIEGEAEYIVTGDKDLLTLERYQGIPIVTPVRFAALLEAGR